MSEYDSSKNFKTIIIGKSAVGKSTLLLRYVDGQFNAQKPTIGIDYRFKKITHQGTTFNLELWDSAGQQRYRTIVYNYFSLSKAACIVFDINTEDSLGEAKMWLQQLVLHCGNDIPKLLLGNKCDLLSSEQLEEKIEKIKPEIDKLKQEYKCQFFAVSAYTGKNVNEAFQFLIKQLCKNNKTPSSPEKKNDDKFKLKSTSVLKEQKNTKKKCCQ